MKASNLKLARTRRDAGFTLIEVVMSLLIGGLTLFGLWNGLRLIGLNWERAHLVAEERDMWGRGIDSIRRDFNRMRRIIRDPLKDPRFAFVGTKQRVRFVVAEPDYPDRPGLYIIGLDITQGTRETLLIRRRAPYHPKLKSFTTAKLTDRVVLLSGEFAAKFSYLASTKTGRPKWRNSWSNRRRLPTLIKLEVRDLRSGKSAMPAIVFSPRVNAEADCVGSAKPLCSPRNKGELPDDPGTTASGTTESESAFDKLRPQ